MKLALIGLVVISMLTSITGAPTAGGVSYLVLGTHIGTSLDCGDSTNYVLLAHWDHNAPLSVFFHSSIPAELRDEVRRGMDAWESEEHPSGSLASEVSFSTANIVVRWGSIDGAGGTLARTVLALVDGGVHVTNAEITFDSAESWGTSVALSCSATPPISVIDVSTHEFGHALIVLGHGSHSSLTMYTNYHAAMRTLATGDKQGVANQQWHGHGGGGPCETICPLSTP